MTSEEIYKEMQMPYEDLCTYLIQKYGGAVVDYFPTPECRSKSKKVSRTSEGLECHHMDEDKGVLLSDSTHAKVQPFEWQKKERLVYCNMLEHLILHMKIFVLATGVFNLCRDINDVFMKDGTAVAWRKRCFEEIRDNYDDYIILLKSILSYIRTNYIKKESVPLVPGAIINISGCNCEVLMIAEKRKEILLKMPSGKDRIFHTNNAPNYLKNIDCINSIARKLSTGYEIYYEKIYKDINEPCNKSVIDEYCQFLVVDNDEPDYSPTIIIYSSDSIVLTEEYNTQKMYKA